MADTNNIEELFSTSEERLLQGSTDLSEKAPSELSASNSYTSETPLIQDVSTDVGDIVACDNEAVSTSSVQDIGSERVLSQTDNHYGYDLVESNKDKTLDNETDCSHGDNKLDSHMDRLSVCQSVFSHQSSVNAGQSVIDIREPTEQVHIPALNMIGASWECGSVSSIYRLAASKEGFRSRLGTMEKQSNLGSYDFIPQNRLLSRVFTNSISSFQFSKKGSVIEDLHKSIILDKDEAELEGFDLEANEEVKPRNFKNLCVASIGLTLLYFAIGGLRNLQSSLNAESGVLALAAMFAAFTFGSLISPFVVQMYRPKLCIILGFTGHIFYVFANYWPKMEYLVPSSLIMGLANALTWNAVCTYITELGINEAYRKNQFASHVLSRYFGLFFLTQQASTVFGNLISSLILVPKSPATHQPPTSVFNDSIINHINQSYTSLTQSVCGVGFSSINSNDSTTIAVDEFDKLFLLGTYATCVIISVLAIVIFLDHLPNYSAKSSSICEVLVQAKDVISMTVDRKFMFVIVLCLYTVIGNGFVVADTLRAYVTCPLGIYMVGYAMICFGVCGSVSSMTFGRLQKYIGRVPIFLIATLINVVSLLTMVTWLPTSADVYYIFVLLGAWGFADGIWQSQAISLISSVFEERYETALGCFRFLQGIAGIVVFLLSDLLDMRTKIIVVLGTCLLAFILYMVMEVMLKCEKKRGQEVVEIKIDDADVTIDVSS